MGLMKLGKQPADKTTPRLYLAKYVPSEDKLPPLPSTPFSWTGGKTDWGMLGNDEHGDCVFAGVGHTIQVATHNTWGEVTITTDETLGYYSKWAGYDPTQTQPDGSNPTDNGAVIVDILNKLMAQGFGMPGGPLHGIEAFADVDVTNITALLHAIHLFGPVATGVQLPVAVQGAQEWTVVPDSNDPNTDPGSWGGHDVTLTGFDQAKQMIEFISWGTVMWMSVPFLHAYVDETHAQFVKGWQYRPGSLDIKTMKADFAQLGTVHS